MVCGPSLVGPSDWAPVAWDKRPTGKAAKTKSAVTAARRSGTDVDTDKKFAGGTNKATGTICPNAKKFDENCEIYRHATVSHAFRQALQQARLAKKMSLQVLAAAVNEKSTVINEYEAGKAIPNGQIVDKLNRALGVRLPKAK